jgi:hypothetical protein
LAQGKRAAQPSLNLRDARARNEKRADGGKVMTSELTLTRDELVYVWCAIEFARKRQAFRKELGTYGIEKLESTKSKMKEIFPLLEAKS